jgi:acyl-CoA reductase-like NAD-dependent aldehyde dehydrogenase
VRDFTMTIGGQGVPATASFDVDNPATGEIIASAPECRSYLDGTAHGPQMVAETQRRRSLALRKVAAELHLAAQ